MKILNKLETSKSFWSILIICVGFFLLRLPSLTEPYWYGDEGIYEVIGQALHQGRTLYTDIWDNKPPLLYVMFAFFNGSQEPVRLLSLIFGLFSIIVFFILSRKLFKKVSVTIIVTALFALLFGSPFLEGNIANAENFMLLPIIAAGLLIYDSQKIKLSILNVQVPTLFIAGLLLGIAFLYKIVAVFDLAAFLLFIVLASKIKFSILKSLPAMLRIAMQAGQVSTLLLGFLFPFIITTLYFLFQGAFREFIQSIFFGNITYVGEKNVLFAIPQGFLIIKVLLLLGALSLIFFNRHRISRRTLFILLWLSFSLFNAFFSQRPYTHYLLMLLPSFCLLIGLIGEFRNKTQRVLLFILIISILLLVKNNFWITSPDKTFLYYQNLMLFMTGQKDVQSYRSFFDKRTPRDYELASFISSHTKDSDDVFIWGDSPQIYALAHKLPINRFTVAYHITLTEKEMENTQQQLNAVQPKYIITLSETQPFPFSAPFYTIRFANEGATIYERNY